MSDRDPEQETQAEVRHDAEVEGEDPVTRREALETELMEQGESDAGEAMGDPAP